MESWLQRVILTALLCGFTSCLFSLSALAEEEKEEDRLLEDLISPDVKRRDIDEAKIDTENWELGIYTGVLSIEDFGSSDVQGLRFAFHVNEDVFLELSGGIAQAQPTSFELLSGASPLLTEDERDMYFYHLDVGITILPGEVYLGKRAFNSHLFLIGGGGNTDFADNEYFTYNYGVGFRMFATDWIAVRFDFRNYVFTHAIFGEDKRIQNLEYQLGISLYL